MVKCIKRGRPRIRNPIERKRDQWRRASTKYYSKNREIVLAKARETYDPVKRREAYDKWKKERR